LNLGDSNNIFESIYTEKINTGTRIVDMNNLSLNAGEGASSVGVEIPCNLQEVVFNVITTEYGYPTNIYILLIMLFVMHHFLVMVLNST